MPVRGSHRFDFPIFRGPLLLFHPAGGDYVRFLVLPSVIWIPYCEPAHGYHKFLAIRERVYTFLYNILFFRPAYAVVADV